MNLFDRYKQETEEVEDKHRNEIESLHQEYNCKMNEVVDDIQTKVLEIQEL